MISTQKAPESITPVVTGYPFFMGAPFLMNKIIDRVGCRFGFLVDIENTRTGSPYFPINKAPEIESSDLWIRKGYTKHTGIIHGLIDRGNFLGRYIHIKFGNSHRQTQSSQSIEPALSTLLSLSKDLEDEFVVLYNGPRCGASAPDHLHLQVGNAGFLPLEEEYERLITDAGEKVADRGGVLVFAVDSGLRRFVAIESDEQEEASEACRRLFRVLQEFFGDAEEPMMNILSWYKEGEWKVVVFPRAKHRPSVFYDQQNGLLVSPAAVDLAGVVITPRAEDFARITTDNVETIFHEVVISPDAFEKVRERLVMSYGRMP